MRRYCEKQVNNRNANSVSGICHKPASLHWTQVAQDVIRIATLQTQALHHSSSTSCWSPPNTHATTCIAQTKSMADNASGTGSASMSISSGSEISDIDDQKHELHATSSSADHTSKQAHHDTHHDGDHEVPRSQTLSRRLNGDYEDGYEGDDDDEDQTQDARHDSKESNDPKEGRTRTISARSDEQSERAVKHERPASQHEDEDEDEDEDESENDKTSIPASSFEDVANRSARKATAMIDREVSNSESDSEDILVGPRNSQYESSNANETPNPRFSVMGSSGLHPRSQSPSPASDELGAEVLDNHNDSVASSEKDDGSSSSSSEGDDSSYEAEGKVDDGSSGLSDLSSTPEPAEPELVHSKDHQKRHKLHVCKCEGWCSCERYTIFAGFGPSEMDDDAPRGIATKKSSESDATSTQDHALEADADQEDNEDITKNTTSRREISPIDGGNERHEADVLEEDENEFPSQTHLSERVLAGKLFAESGMRSTIENKKRRCDSEDDEDERDPKKIRAGQVFSWDRVAKPPRPPTGWVGGVWKNDCDENIPAPREIQDSEDEADDEVKV